MDTDADRHQISSYADSIDKSSSNTLGQATEIEKKLQMLASRQRDADARIKYKQAEAFELAQQLYKLYKLAVDVDWIYSKGVKPNMSSADYLQHLASKGVDPSAGRSSAGDDDEYEAAGRKGFEALQTSVGSLSKWESCRDTVVAVATKSVPDLRQEVEQYKASDMAKDRDRYGKIDALRKKLNQQQYEAASEEQMLEEELAAERDLKKYTQQLHAMAGELALHEVAWFSRSKALTLVLRAVNSENHRVERDLASAGATVDEMIGSLDALLGSEQDKPEPGVGGAAGPGPSTATSKSESGRGGDGHGAGGRAGDGVEAEVGHGSTRAEGGGMGAELGVPEECLSSGSGWEGRNGKDASVLASVVGGIG